VHKPPLKHPFCGEGRTYRRRRKSTNPPNHRLLTTILIFLPAITLPIAGNDFLPVILNRTGFRHRRPIPLVVQGWRPKLIFLQRNPGKDHHGALQGTDILVRNIFFRYLTPVIDLTGPKKRVFSRYHNPTSFLTFPEIARYGG
jgi:hypothetical protein